MKLIVLIALFCSNLLKAELDGDSLHNLKVLFAEPNEQLQLARKEMIRWEMMFSKSLLEQEDVNLKVIGFDKMFIKTVHMDDEALEKAGIDFKALADDIMEFAESPNVSPQTLMRLKSLCGGKRVDTYCDEDRVELAQVQATPKNMMVHFAPLQQAVNFHSNEDIKYLFEQMASSEYIDIYTYLSPEFISFTKRYVSNHPFPISHLESELEQMKLMRGISEEKLKQIENNMEEFATVNMLIGIKLALAIPGYRPMIDQCKTNATLVSQCEKIADILVTKSKSDLSRAVGENLKKIIADHSGDAATIQQAEIILSEFKSQWDCLIKARSASKYIMDPSYDLKGFEKSNQIERSKGSLAAVLYDANLIYQKLKVDGNADAIDPKSCGLKIYEH